MTHEEPQVVDALVALCVEMKIGCVVQVGAGDGYEADMIRRATGARAICFDADPTAVACCDEIEFYEALIGDCHMPEMDFFKNAVPGLSTKVRRGEGEQLLVLAQWTLDILLDVLRATPDALIIDTEGTTMEVLEGATRVLCDVRLVYAECQTSEIRPGISGLVEDVDAFLRNRGFVRREGLPAYDAGGQGNYCWVRA